MEHGRIALTAVFLKSNHGYVGFIEELPGVNSHGRTIEEARREAEELIAGKEVVREAFVFPIPRAK